MTFLSQLASVTASGAALLLSLISLILSTQVQGSRASSGQGTPLAYGIGQGGDGKVEGDSCGEPCSLGMWEQHFGVGEDGESLQNQVQ